jgi:hypothetical protein
VGASELKHSYFSKELSRVIQDNSLYRTNLLLYENHLVSSSVAQIFHDKSHLNEPLNYDQQATTIFFVNFII